MNFRPRQKEEPEINLIPFIDVLLVVLIFLMLSTTYSKFTELQLKLPVATPTSSATTVSRESTSTGPDVPVLPITGGGLLVVGAGVYIFGRARRRREEQAA